MHVFDVVVLICQPLPAEPNANEFEQSWILLIYIRFGAWEEWRLKRALHMQT